MSRRKRSMLIGLAVFVGIVLAVAGVLIWQVDDWRRDLTTNTAATSESAARPELRPVDSPLSPEKTARLVEAAGQGLAGWELVRSAAAGDGWELAFVRTTRLMRYKDDIRVKILPRGTGSRVEAESGSRVGRGDLGQNPRNLAELLGALRERLGAPSQGALAR